MHVDQVKQLILRCYRKLDPRSLDGLKLAHGGYLTADLQWVYFIRNGGFIERKALQDVLSAGGSQEGYELFVLKGRMHARPAGGAP